MSQVGLHIRRILDLEFDNTQADIKGVLGHCHYESAVSQVNTRTRYKAVAEFQSASMAWVA